MKWYHFKKRAAVKRELLEAGIWFVDIPRTGSTSLKEVLGERFGPTFGKSYDYEKQERTQNSIVDHSTSENVIGIVSRAVWQKLYTFSIVRNPWDRFYSIYQYRIKDGAFKQVPTFKEYAAKLSSPECRDYDTPFSFNEFHYRMTDYLCAPDGSLNVSQWFKSEERLELYEVLSKRFGAELPQLKRNVISSHNEYLQHYDSETIDIVGRHYASDVEMFGYSFEPSEAE